MLENAVGTTYNFTCRAKMETYGVSTGLALYHAVLSMLNADG